ncbi:MAG TPA: hypothetical protein VIJ61_02810 [Thermoanaerobaculia bacterium]
MSPVEQQRALLEAFAIELMSGRRSTRKSATSTEESGLVVFSGYGFWYALGEVSLMALLKDSERLITGEELFHSRISVLAIW